MQKKFHIIDNTQLGYPVPGRNKYWNMTLQVGGVSKIESMKFTQFKITDSTSCQSRLPTSLNQELSKIV
jgi:hypothetical protein